MNAYHRFIDASRELFGLSYGEAQSLYRDMKDELGDIPSVDDLVQAPDIIYFGTEEEEPEYDEDREVEYDGYIYDIGEPDPFFEHEYGDDDILYPDDEIELSAELTYGERT